MSTYRLIITDVTCYGTLYCVAGWDLDNGGMIRPEPSTTNITIESSRFWDAQKAGAGKFFDVGNVVQFDADMPPANFPYPHATEDRVAKAGRRALVIGRHPLDQVARQAAGSISASLSAAFGGQLNRAISGKAHVAPGERTHSLGAIEIAPNQITFFEDNPSPGKRRLRAKIKQGEIWYDLSVPADAARNRFLADGIPALQADARASARIHVRVGLSRPFAAMPCYAQVNGLYFL